MIMTNPPEPSSPASHDEYSSGHGAAPQPAQGGHEDASSTVFGGAVSSGHHCDVLANPGGGARSHRSRDNTAGG